ncbi:MAG: YceI family protein [Bacteroidetes bacterium]|nr:YceI family protein [Bacteroidota bacterium]
MKKYLIIPFLLILYFSGFTQNVFFSKSGHVYFLSHTDAIDIDANNHQLVSFFDIESGKIQCAVLIKSFEFSLATAKEHFNESYMESGTYPKAEFKGQVNDLENIDLTKPGSYEVNIIGDIIIRNNKKHLETKAELIVEKNKINASTEFYLNISDFNILVPKLVDHRVAKEILVKVSIDYLPYKK